MNTILARLPAYILSQGTWPQGNEETRPRSPASNDLKREADGSAANPDLATFRLQHAITRRDA